MQIAHNVFVGCSLPAAREGHLYPETSQLNAQRKTHDSKKKNRQKKQINVNKKTHTKTIVAEMNKGGTGGGRWEAHLLSEALHCQHCQEIYLKQGSWVWTVKCVCGKVRIWVRGDGMGVGGSPGLGRDKYWDRERISDSWHRNIWSRSP